MAAPAVSASGEAPLRIALMIECDGPGGAELMMLELAKELRARIEAELQYPSTIKITVIRESRFSETAK